MDPSRTEQNPVAFFAATAFKATHKIRRDRRPNGLSDPQLPQLVSRRILATRGLLDAPKDSYYARGGQISLGKAMTDFRLEKEVSTEQRKFLCTWLRE